MASVKKSLRAKAAEDAAFEDHSHISAEAKALSNIPHRPQWLGLKGPNSSGSTQKKLEGLMADEAASRKKETSTVSVPARKHSMK